MPTRFWVRGVLCSALALLLVACSNGRGSLSESAVPVPSSGASANFSIGGVVSGLVGSGLVLQNNGGGNLSVAADGAFTFATLQATGSSYNVTVSSQPTGPAQTCTVANGSGSVASANVTNITVNCVTGQFSVGGTVSGLAGSGLVLQNNGENLPITASGAFTFANRLVDRATYNVTVSTQPGGQACVVRNPSGAIASANVSSVEVSCTSAAFAVGGTVSGLAGSGLVLQLNGSSDLSVVANGSFAFSTALPAGAAYQVTIRTQPSSPSQTCTLANASGTIAGNVTNVAVTCSTRQVVIGGTVSGLSGSGLVLRLNGAGDLAVSSNGRFSFETPLNSGTAYAVTVSTQPTNPAQVCTVANGTGTAGSADVTNIRVTCAGNTFPIGGGVTGLLGSGLVLRNNGGDDLAVSANGSFTFNTRLATGSSYQVTVRTQPSNPAQACTVAGGQGTVGSAAITSVVVSCNTSDFSIGGTVRDLAGSGLVLRNNGADDLAIDASGAFTFATALPTGAAYNVTVAAQPRNPDQSCTVNRGTGVVAGGNVGNIEVRCTNVGFTIGGRVRGLQGSGLVLQNNGSDNLAIASGGRFTFPASLASGAPFNVTVATQPVNPGQSCTVDHGSGTVRDRDVDDVEVRCRGGD